MVKSDLVKFGLISGVLISMIGGLTAAWEPSAIEAFLDPAVEKACYDEVVQRAPLGHRTIMTMDYHEEGSLLGIVSGSIEAQYAPNQWTNIDWTCRINPTDRKIARVELAAAGGGQRMRAAMQGFR